MRLKQIVPYLLGILWIATWWSYPFFLSSSHIIQLKSFSYDPLERAQLRQALGGDIASMQTLLLKWQSEADSALFQKTLALTNTLPNYAEKNSFLPQTYPSACFLLALLPRETLLCLPLGLQEHKLFNFSIPHQTLPHQYSEFLWKTKPTLTFISNYSNPVFISLLKSLQLPSFHLHNLHKIQHIQRELKIAGQKIGYPQKAKLLSLFMKAAIKAIDYKLHQICFQKKISLDTFKKVFLFHHLHFTIPSSATLTGELLAKLHIDNTKHVDDLHDSMATFEQLKKIDPDLIIIAAENQEKLQKQISYHQFFSQLKAQIFFVDSTIQQSPTQFAVLAYHDLASCLINYLRTTYADNT